MFALNLLFGDFQLEASFSFVIIDYASKGLVIDDSRLRLGKKKIEKRHLGQKYFGPISN